MVTASGISPSDCGCGCGGGGGKCSCGGGGGKPSLVYALGNLDYDFGTEARRDSFVQAGVANPHDAGQLLAYLTASPASASSIIWTLNQDSTAIYAIQPKGAFVGSRRMRSFGISCTPNAQWGWSAFRFRDLAAGKIALLNGQVVPVILPEDRGTYSWSTTKLVEAVAGPRPPAEDAKGIKKHDLRSQDIGNFLDRVYYEIRNLGPAPQERAMNYAATNAFQVDQVFEAAINADLKLDSITVERSPICRPGSDCWDVKLTFFNPSKRLEQARHVYRFTVDVSDFVPVTVGGMRHWDVF